MDKKVPHYQLLLIQAEVRRSGANAFTRTALDGGREMGLSVEKMVAAVCDLTSRQFFKSMTTIADHSLWQDVYHAPTSGGWPTSNSRCAKALWSFNSRGSSDETPVLELRERRYEARGS